MSKAQVAAHRLDAPAIEGKVPRVGMAMARMMRTVPVKVENVLEDGQTVGPFTVIHLPGHTPGTVAFLNKARGLLFTGDALVTGKSGKLALSRRMFNYDQEGAAASLRKLMDVKPTAVFPGHGAVVVDNAADALQEVVKRLTSPPEPYYPTTFGPEGRPELHPGLPGWKGQ
jgi:glyoxylase-like metal-dependent hydrolase (beta-lactamase superfamily II)